MNDLAQTARLNAIPVEVKKHSYRQTKDGIVISFVMHPNDVSPELAASALGTRYMAALVEISDDEQPVEKPKRSWHELSVGEQAGIRCGERSFWNFIGDLGSVTTWPNSPDEAAEILRKYFEVSSRKDIPREKWRALESDYQHWLRT